MAKNGDGGVSKSVLGQLAAVKNIHSFTNFKISIITICNTVQLFETVAKSDWRHKKPCRTSPNGCR